MSLLMRFNKLHCFLAILLWVNCVISAQQGLRLLDCYEIALNNRSDLENIKIDKNNAGILWEHEKAGFLPTVNLAYNHSLNYNSQTNSFLGTYNGSLAVSGSMVLYDWFSYWKQIEKAELTFSNQNNYLRQREFQILTEVAENYFSVLLKKEQLIASHRQLSVTDTIVDNTRILFSLRKIIETDLTESELQRIQEKKGIIELKKEFEFASFKLAEILQSSSSALNLDFDFFELAFVQDTISLMDYEEFYELALSYSPYLESLEYERQIQILNHKLTRTQNHPKLLLKYSTSSGYSELTMQNPEINFDRNIENSFSGLVTLELSIPIYNQNKARSNYLISKSEIQKKENDLALEKQRVTAILRRHYTDAKASIDKLVIAKEELATTEQVLHDKLLLYNNGKENIFTLLAYKQKYNEVLYNFIVSKYEVLFKTELLKIYSGYYN